MLMELNFFFFFAVLFYLLGWRVMKQNCSTNYSTMISACLQAVFLLTNLIHKKYDFIAEFVNVVILQSKYESK
jgi:hypothetical protein